MPTGTDEDGVLGGQTKGEEERTTCFEERTNATRRFARSGLKKRWDCARAGEGAVGGVVTWKRGTFLSYVILQH